MTYRYILEAFPRLGRGPTLAEMETDLRIDKECLPRILKTLEAEGAINLDPQAVRIMDAFPYSTKPTEHTVLLPSGGRVCCMCAIDAFYVPFLTESQLRIRSRCFHCRSEIEVHATPNIVSLARPATAIIWDSASSDTCPKTNFFCSEAHLLQWSRCAPGELGKMCALDAALDRGRTAVSRIRETWCVRSEP